MAKVRITGHARNPMKAVLFEPRQTPEQDEVILDEIVLAAGEEKEVDLRSATAGYRLVPLTGEEREKLDKEPEPEIAPDQEGTITQASQAEMDAGSDNLKNYDEDGQQKSSRAAPKPKSEKK